MLPRVPPPRIGQDAPWAPLPQGVQLSCECAARACLTGTVQRWQLLGRTGRGAHCRAAATHGWRQPPLNAALLLLAFTADPAQHVKPVMGS